MHVFFTMYTRSGQNILSTLAENMAVFLIVPYSEGGTENSRERYQLDVAIRGMTVYLGITRPGGFCYLCQIVRAKLRNTPSKSRLDIFLLTYFSPLNALLHPRGQFG